MYDCTLVDAFEVLQKHTAPCMLWLLQNEVIWPLQNILKYWFVCNEGMTCATTGRGSAQQQVMAKSSPSTSLPREASYEMTWQHACIAAAGQKYHSTFFSLHFFSKKKKKKVEQSRNHSAPEHEQHSQNNHMQDPNHNKHSRSQVRWTLTTLKQTVVANIYWTISEDHSLFSGHSEHLFVFTFI